ncbi:MAG: type III pantothenate kinase [Pseudomonadota bacterium]
MKLLLDIGNSAISWLLRDDREIIQKNRFFYEIENIEQIFQEHFSSLTEINTVLISSVLASEQNKRISDWCKAKWDPTVWQAETSSEFAGLINSYTEPQKLGVDRWLSMIAARAEFDHHLLIVDCGTAVTIDKISSDGMHDGGFILPGLLMLQEAVISKSNRINAESITNGDILLANNTQDAISNGAKLSIIASIEYVISEFKKNDKLTVIITGGDALPIMNNLSANIVHRPMLVLDGLFIVYEASK